MFYLQPNISKSFKIILNEAIHYLTLSNKVINSLLKILKVYLNVNYIYNFPKRSFEKINFFK